MGAFGVNFSCTGFSEVQIRSRKNMIVVKATAPAITHSSFQVALSWSSSSGGRIQPPRRRSRTYPSPLAPSSEV